MTQRPAMAAYAIDGRPVSAEAFYAAACHPARHAVVEACAGAGKTWMLVSRILRALLAGAEPQQILAITFTKKAAAEMRQRLNEWLAEFADATPDRLVQELQARGMPLEQARADAPALQSLYLRLLQSGRSVQIRTFHSWFAALLRSAPLQVLRQLGLPTQYELLENDAPAVAEVWRPFYRVLQSDPEALADYQALAAAHGRSRTAKALGNALAARVEFALADASGVVEASVPHFSMLAPEMAAYQDPLERLQGGAAHQRWHAWSAALGAESNKTPQKAASQVVDAFLQEDLTRRFELLRDAFYVKSEERLSNNLVKFDAAQAADAELQLLCPAVRQHVAWQHQQRMARLTRLLLQVYAQLKRERGWVDMHDIEQAARTLLQDPVVSGWVQERLDAQLRHLLVDEFQDTNPMQWHALHAWLSGYAGAASAPCVFIVGDPKQSIYRFRGADPKVFSAARDFVQQGLGGAVLSCDHTRRNSQAVINAVNAVMLAAQARGGYADFREHTTGSSAPGCVLTLPRIERPEKAEAGDATWRDSLTQPKLEVAEKPRELECRQAARWLQRCIQAGVPAGEVLVMARKNDRVTAMQRALGELGLPAHRVEKVRLADAPEVQDVVALIDVLLSPRHDLSLAQALKSPLFGLSDEQLIDLELAVRAAAQQEGADTGVLSWLFWLLQQAEVPESVWQPIGARLRRWQRWVQQWLPHDALDAIYREGDVLARYAAATPAAQRATVLERLQALPAHTLALDGGRYASSYRWVRAMRGGDATDAPRAAGDDDSIRLLTIHGAKGLEAGLVLVLDAQPESSNASGMAVLTHWPGEHESPQKLVFLTDSRSTPPSLQTLLAQEEQAQAREEANGLYVAMTRARQVLAFSAAEPHRSDKAVSWWEQWQGHAAAEALTLDEAGLVALPACGLPEIRSAAADKVAPEQTGQQGIGLHTIPPLAEHLRRHTQATTFTVQGDAERQLQGRMGEAMHKALEWQQQAAVPDDKRQLALQQLFQLDPQQAQTALQCARNILQGDAAWAWGDGVDWQANELDIGWQGSALRLDRLVRRKAQAGAPASWWVLDYKSALQPLQQADLRAQLDAYRQAVQALHPQEPVHAAFVSADGRLHLL